MNYRPQAIILGLLSATTGASFVYYAIGQAQNSSSSIPVTLYAFLGLGLILFGSLFLFITPENLISTSVFNSALSPAINDLTTIIHSLGLDDSLVHVPSGVLGSPHDVILTVRFDRHGQRGNPEVDPNSNRPVWKKTSGVLIPVGLDLMKNYERILGRDFLALDFEQLSRFLSKSIVSELQLSSGFRLKTESPHVIEASWRKPLINHTCCTNEGDPIPELCSPCSSIACALAKSTGKSVRIRESKSSEGSRTITTTFLVLEA